MLSLASIFALTTVAQQWEQIQVLPATQSIFVAPNGNLISSDFQFDYSGGIYYSTDKGTTWTKADVPDYAYSRMIQAGEYIIASGECCNLARSKDNGVTWELLNYGYMLTDYIGEEGAEYDLAYAITYFKEKLFVADFGGGGVLYSEDFGETWTMTDRESLKYALGSSRAVAKGDGSAIDSFYNLAENNNELLLFGMYFIYRLNESDYTWELLRSDSNFMGVSTTIDDKLICGRGIMNYNEKSHFLEYTTDAGRNWAYINHADTATFDTNVRALHSDEKGLYCAMQAGNMFYTTDFGANWLDLSKGLPAGCPTLIITSDDEYLYAAVYSEPFKETTFSGVYRYSKNQLPVANVTNTHNDKFDVYVVDNTLYLATAADITIYNINGQVVATANNCNTVNINNLPQGVYLYEVTGINSHTTGKFVK